MATESPQGNLESLAAQAQDRSARLAAEGEHRRGLPPGPGDLFVLPATADLPVEWAVLDRQPGPAGKLLAVPADAGPPAGSADVAVEAGAPGGPLNLRCRFAVWLEPSLFDSGQRTGVLAPEAVAEAIQCRRAAEAGEVGGSPLAEEVDADPEYQDWIREVVEPARELAAARRPPREVAPPERFWRGVHSLAAALAAVSVGLAVWVALLLGEVDRLNAPVLDRVSGGVVLGSNLRGNGEVIEVPRGDRYIRLALVLDSLIEPGEGLLKIVDEHGRDVLPSERIEISPGDEFSLRLPREFLPDGEYWVLLYRGDGKDPVAEEKIRIETAK